MDNVENPVAQEDADEISSLLLRRSLELLRMHLSISAFDYDTTCSLRQQTCTVGISLEKTGACLGYKECYEANLRVGKMLNFFLHFRRIFFY